MKAVVNCFDTLESGSLQSRNKNLILDIFPINPEES